MSGRSATRKKSKASENVPRNAEYLKSGAGADVAPSSPRVRRVVFTYGRFQPPTVGHARLVRELASRHSGTTDVYAFVSHTTDPPSKNPLSAYQKVTFLTKMHPGTPVRFVNCAEQDLKGAAKVLGALREAYPEGTQFQLIVGEDPDQSFDWITKQGVELIELTRPNIALMSGTEMRKAARSNSSENSRKFRNGVKLGAMTNSNVEALRDLLRARQGGGRRRSNWSQRTRKN